MADSGDSPYIICPKCKGYGLNPSGSSCGNCGGLGMGKYFSKRFFYWGPRLGRAVIELDHIRHKMHLAVNLAAYAIGLAGLFSLAWWVYQTVQNTEQLEAFYFWQERDILILFFWIGLLACMFAIYRLSEEERRQHLIKPLTYQEKEQSLEIPSGWEELKAFTRRYKVDVSQGYTGEAVKTVEKAFTAADKLDQPYVTPVHLFYASLSDRQVAAMLSRLNVPPDKLIDMLQKRIQRFGDKAPKTRLSRTLKEVLVDAYLQAKQLGQEKVSAKNFIIPCLDKDEILREILYELEVDRQKIMNVLLWFIINERQVQAYRQYRKLARFKPGTNMDRAYTSVATPTLNQLGYDLTLAAKWNKLEFCVAREKEIGNIWQNFESGAAGVLLAGPPGVGKNTIIDGIAQLMVKENVPKDFRDKRLMEVDTARLISGASPSQAQGRLMAVLDEVSRAGNIVLYIKDIENIVGITSGEEESLDLSEVLAGALERKQLYCLATVSSKNYSSYIENTSLGEIMAKIEVEEPKQNQAIQIVESKVGYYEGKYKVYFSYGAIEQVIKLTQKYIHDRYLPEKAIKVMELAAVKISKSKGKDSVVSHDDISEIISEQTKIPVNKIGDQEGKDLLKLEDRIHERMVNQEEAVKMVSASLRRARTQLREGKRPIANFLFLGPTGVGKTELAKSVSEVYFGREDYMARIDMSEFQHIDSIKKMIGDASGAKGRLTEAVRQQPFTLVLLDEIEKAHPDILNLFLQVMDDGRLTDGQGRTVDFTNSIVIATSNAGAVYIKEQVFAGKKGMDIKDALINEHLVKVMRPELINRFDGIIVFEPLSMENVVEIARLMLKKIEKMLEAKGIAMRIEEEGVRRLAKAGFDPQYGARPLRRLLQEKVEDAIANYILMGSLKRRDTVVVNAKAEVEIEKGRKII